MPDIRTSPTTQDFLKENHYKAILSYNIDG